MEWSGGIVKGGVVTSYEIVTAGSGDIGAPLRLSSALFVQDAGTRDPFTEVSWPATHGWDHFSALVYRDDALCLLAVSGRTPVGYLAGLIRRPTTVRPVSVAELQSMYVERDVRNRGVGSRLVEAFL